MNERPQSQSPGSPLSAEDVADYLQINTDFLIRHPEILEVLAPPSRTHGDGVVDMQQFMLERLRGEVDNLRGCTMELIDTSRRNLSGQTRTHAAVLALMGAGDLAHLIRIVGDDLPLLLDVETVVIGFEPPPKPLSGLSLPGVRRLPVGMVDHLLGVEADVSLRRYADDDGTVFGAAAGLVLSAAFARLRPGRAVPCGLIALGARDKATFHPAQGTELVAFMARVAESCLHRWLAPPN